MSMGSKIKKARRMRDNMTQALLGKLSGMSGERIRAYEAGNRTPKETQIKAISDSLGIPTEYFYDHNIESLEDTFMALFEIEELFNLSVSTFETIDKNGNKKLVYGLSTDNFGFNMYLMKWYEKKRQLTNGEITPIQYELWCARLKKSVEEDMQDDLHRKMIQQIEIDKKQPE